MLMNDDANMSDDILKIYEVIKMTLENIVDN